MSWRDRDGRQIDLVVPDNGADIGVFVNGTDWLATAEVDFGAEGITWRLTDVERGLRFDTADNPQGTTFVADAVPAISPDGRWLAEVGDFGTSVIITNLTIDSSVEVELDQRITNGLVYTDD